MNIELSDPTLVPALRSFLSGRGCPSEPRSDTTFEVVVLRGPGEKRTWSDDRATVVLQLREWCAAHPGVHVNVLSE